MGVYIGKKEVGLVLNVRIAQDNISIMKSADLMSNIEKSTNYNSTDEEYEKAEIRLQKICSKIMGVVNE